MSAPVDSLKSTFRPLLDHTLHQALVHRIAQDFPRIGGPRILDLCAQMVLEVVSQYQRPKEQMQHAQVLWTAVSLDEPPARRRTTANTKLVPVVLDLYPPEDVQARMDRVPARDRILSRALRLCRQAYEQGALLSNRDLEALLGTNRSDIGSLLASYERKHGVVVPRRATLHDVGTGLTHKRIICWKHHAEGKAAEIVARETYHSLEAVDRYLGQYARVRRCRLEGFTPEQTAFTLNCSLRLVQEYLDIDDELHRPKDQQSADPPGDPSKHGGGQV